MRGKRQGFLREKHVAGIPDLPHFVIHFAIEGNLGKIISVSVELN